MERMINSGLTTPTGGGFRVRAVEPGAGAAQTPRRPIVT